jgi:hypothetical protein
MGVPIELYQTKYVAVCVLPALHERDVDWDVERASCYSLQFVCQLHHLALLASAAMGFMHSKLRNYLGRDTAEKLVLVETNYLQFTVNTI